MEHDLSITFDMDELIKEKEKRAARKSSPKQGLDTLGRTKITPKKETPKEKYGIKQFNFQQENNKITLELNFENNVPPGLAPQILDVVQKYLKKNPAP